MTLVIGSCMCGPNSEIVPYDLWKAAKQEQLSGRLREAGWEAHSDQGIVMRLLGINNMCSCRSSFQAIITRHFHPMLIAASSGLEVAFHVQDVGNCRREEIVAIRSLHQSNRSQP